jgi:serine protease Do
LELAKAHLNKAYQLNMRDLDAMLALARVAYVQKDLAALEALKTPVRNLDVEQADEIDKKISQLKVSG